MELIRELLYRNFGKLTWSESYLGYFFTSIDIPNDRCLYIAVYPNRIEVAFNDDTEEQALYRIPDSKLYATISIIESTPVIDELVSALTQDMLNNA